MERTVCDGLFICGDVDFGLNLTDTLKLRGIRSSELGDIDSDWRCIALIQ